MTKFLSFLNKLKDFSEIEHKIIRKKLTNLKSQNQIF